MEDEPAILMAAWFVSLVFVAGLFYSLGKPDDPKDNEAPKYEVYR